MNIGIGLGLTVRRRAGGTAAVNWYVDSVGGSDANSGLSSALPLQTIAALTAKSVLAGHALNFKRGSYWREQYTLQADHLTLQTYGSGAAPVFDGADVVPTWTNVGGGTPNVWSASFTRPTTPSATEYLGLWADGVRPRFATSLADLQTNGGWYTSDRTAQNGTAYVKSVADPNSSGVVYRITKRQHCIVGHEQDAGVSRISTTVGPFEMRGCYGHYNALSGSLGSAANLILRDGSAHYTVTEGDLTDVCFTDEYKAPSSNSPCIQATFYRDLGAGHSATGKRLLFSGNADTALSDDTGAQAILAHNSTNGWDSITLEQCWVKSFNNGISAGSPGITNLTIRGCFSDSLGSLGDQFGSVTNTATVTHHLGRSSTLSDGGPDDNTARTRTIQHAAITNPGGNTGVSVSGRTGTLALSNCLIVVGTNSPSAGVVVTPYTGTPSLPIAVTINNCVVVFLGTTPNPVPLSVTRGSGGSYTGNNNLFVYPNGAANTVRFQLDGGNYDGLAAWQAASSQDANSKVLAADTNLLNALFQNGANGLLCGDFRLRTGAYTLPGGQDVATTCGPQQRWDWSPGVRAAVSGANQRWPNPPTTLAAMRTYTSAPDSWDFYPARTTPPTAGSITGTATNDSQYTVTFSAGSAADAVAGAYAPDAYLVEDGTVVAGPISSPYTRTGRTNGQTYAVKIRYQDVAGNTADTAASNVVPAVPSVDPLLDDFGSAKIAFSTRLLRTAYAGKCLRVRRSSDNAEADIGFTAGPNAALDEATLLAVVGAGDGYVVTWYDQSGNGLDATQSTDALQHRIVVAGVVQRAGTRAAILGDSSTGHYYETANLGLTQPFTVFLRSKNTAGSESFDTPYSFFTTGPAVAVEVQMSSQTGATMTAQVRNGFSNVASQPQDAITYLLASGGSSEFSSNAAADTAVNTGGTNPDGIARIGNHWTGLTGELVVWNSDQSAHKGGIRDNTNSWWGVY